MSRSGRGTVAASPDKPPDKPHCSKRGLRVRRSQTYISSLEPDPLAGNPYTQPLNSHLELGAFSHNQSQVAPTARMRSGKAKAHSSLSLPPIVRSAGGSDLLTLPGPWTLSPTFPDTLPSRIRKPAIFARRSCT